MRKLFSVLMMAVFSLAMFAATETTVYYTASSDVIGKYTVKLNINRQGDADNWQQYTMTKTDLSYNGDPVYTYTYTDLYDGVGTMQFQLYDGDTWKSQDQPISSWTSVAEYNGKMYVHSTGKWEAAPTGGEEPAQLKAVSVATTWDFAKVAANEGNALYSNKGIKLTAESTPKKTDEVIYSEYSADLLTISEGFDGTSIAFTGEYPIRNNKCCQNGVLHIKAGVAGTIVVKFSDTGTKAAADAKKRYLVVNDEQTEYWTSRENNGTENPYAAQLDVISGPIAVPAGDITITGTSAITIYSVAFEPKAEEPVDLMTVYFYNNLGWESVNGFVWPETGNAYKEWPGEAAEKEAEKINDVDVYAYTFPASYTNVIFNNGTAQTADLKWDASKPYFVPSGEKDSNGKYTGIWYAKADIPSNEPAQQDVAIKLVPGAWNTDEAKFAAVTWKKGESMYANGVITDWFVGTDTVVGMIPADADSIAFASFSKELSAPALDNSIIAHSDMLEIDKVSMLYTITTQGEDIWFGYWGAAPAAAEWFLVGDMTEWETGKISFKDGDIKVNLTEVGKDYGFKVLKIVGGEKIWYGNSGTMSRENHTAWKFDSEEKSNCMFNADIAGEYIFSFQLDKDGEPMITLTYPEKPITPSEHVYSVVGPLMPDGWSEKSTASEMTLAEGVYSYILTDVELAQGVNYEYKIVEDHSWDVSFPQKGNANFNVEKSGIYDVTFTLVLAEDTIYAAIPTLKQEVVVVPTVQIAGDWTDWGTAPVAMTLDESKQFASLSVNLTKGNHEFKVIVAGNWKTKANGGKSYELKRDWTGVAGVTDDATENLLLSADTDGEYTFTWTFANDSLGVTFPEKTDVPDRLEEGYYLIGLHGWTVDDIQATDKFTVNSTDENEFLLENVSLKKDDKFKAVYVQNDAIKTWFPDGDNNDYVVDADHVGTKTIYFRPTYSDEWGGHFYVAPNGGTGMENVNADVKAVKVLRNGQLFIIRGEHTYTPAGQMVK